MTTQCRNANRMQSDLVLTSSVNWSGDAAQIIESAQQEFEVSEERDLCLTTADLIDTEERRSVTGRESWGNYFAKKSPPMGDLCGSHGVDANTTRPLFDQSANSKLLNLNPSKQAPSHLAMISEQMNELSKRNSLAEAEKVEDDDEHDEDEHEAMLINQSLDGQAMDGMVASKSIDSINLSDLQMQQLNPSYLSGSPLCSNRLSNATLKTGSGSNRGSDLSSRRGSLNRLIQIAKLAQIQRFYQFKLDEHALHELLRQRQRQSNNGNNGDVEEEVERLMLAFLDAFYAEPAHASLSAVTFKAEERKCTVLVLFEEEASAAAAQTATSTASTTEWMEHFLSFEPLSAIRDKNEEPVFTQLSANK